MIALKRGLELVYLDPDNSTASIDLDAANPDNLPTQLERFGVIGHEVAPARAHGFPTWRYTGTLTARSDFLAWNYDDDGSGDNAWYMLGELIEHG